MIPKIIHFCWLSGEPYPDVIENCIRSWREYLPDYEIRLWDINSLDLDSYVWLKQSFNEKKYAFSADFIRLYALYHFGGIYLDSDVQVLKSFNDILNVKSFIGFETGGNVEPAVIGAEPNIEWIKDCLDYYTNRKFILENGKFDMRPLPTIMGRIMQNKFNLLLEDNNRIQDLDCGSLKLYPSQYFSPKSIHSNKIHYSAVTYTIHHFQGKWVRKNLKFYIKIFIHNLLIVFFGQKMHNLIIARLKK